MSKKSGSKAKKSLSVVVAGDAAHDCHIARKRSAVGEVARHYENVAQAYSRRGGCLLLGDMIQKVAGRLLEQKKINCQVRLMTKDSADLSDAAVHRSFAVWSPFAYDTASPGKREVWRVAEFLGLQRSDKNAAGIPFAKNDPAADIIILDDADLGFRCNEDLWKHLKINEKGWILLKMASPVAEGDLWEKLYQEHADRLIVSLTVDDLRLTDVQVSRELSWEATAQDLWRELRNTPAVNSLSNCAHLIVSFGTTGAVLFSHRTPTVNDPRKVVVRLIFDPNIIEGMWRKNHPGGMIGYNTCMTAALARSLMLDPEQPDLEQGVKDGLAAMRRLHLEGYVKEDPKASEPDLGFPQNLVAEELFGSPETDLKKTFAVVDIREPQQGGVSGQSAQTEFWRILEDRCPDGLNAKARDIVLRGAEKVLPDVPLGRFGKLLTVDRREIESLRSIRTLVNEYVKKETNKKPVSIAVFGAPGSGKSFGITQMAEALWPGRIRKLTFNLSQFDASQDLWDALHQVRDVSLSEKIPLVFWDEFDTTFEDKPLGWLRYFLAPMQDGEFQDGQITHPIGRAIFVFAGGTAEQMEDFGGGISPKKYKAVKGPDFVSRLKGYVNILGPNARKTYSEGQLDPDPYYIIRRAILFRSLFEREVPHLLDSNTKELQIDEGVLRALLETNEYKHGVRSMESVLAMSLLKGKRKFERSSLPSEAQLNLHVKAKNFMELVNRINLTENLQDLFARKIHLAYEEKFAVKDSDKRPYEDIPFDEKEQNKELANDIPNKLARIGCAMTPLRRGDREKVFNFKEKEIELLAEMEHERWMRGKLRAGWRYDQQKDKSNKRHDGLLHWREMPETELAGLYSPEELAAIGSSAELSEYYKDIDRHMIKKIPQILAKADHEIVRDRQILDDPGYAIVRDQLVIGVTGHRILTEAKKIEAGIQAALSRIEASFLFRSLVVLSPLAEGADRLVAEGVLTRPDAKLVVPLPFAPEDYEKDFKTKRSKERFQNLLKRASQKFVIGIPADAPRTDAYRAVGEYVLENCDVLVAIWDGRDAQGTGGTGEIVTLARDRNMPIAWIHAGNRRPGTNEPTSLGRKQGKVEFENF